MRPEKLLEVLAVAGRLKERTRHCWISEDRKESVADHSWRLALMAMLLEKEPEFADVDMGRVMKMCLIHDLGEAFTGDIPAFLKNCGDEERETDIFMDWVASFPERDREEWSGLLTEMTALSSREARVYKALDKLEALISHDESDIRSWLPLEYALQMTYGKENTDAEPYLSELRVLVDKWTERKIRTEG